MLIHTAALLSVVGPGKWVSSTAAASNISYAACLLLPVYRVAKRSTNNELEHGATRLVGNTRQQ